MLRVLLLSALATSTAAAASDDGFVALPVAGDVSVLQGHECNVIASAGDDGIVMVDTCVAEVADELLASLRRLSGKPIRFVIDTHAHGDHTGGNAYFQKHAPVIAHRTVRTRLAAGNRVTGDAPAPADALPIITFDSELILHLNSEDIRLLHLPPAHTDGDVVVFFRNANVVCIGDLFMPPAASFGDRHYGGGMLGLIEALELLLPQIPNDAKIVPGHGGISTRADVVRGLEVLEAMKVVVEAAVRSGKTLEQLTAERPFDRWRDSVPPWASSDKSLDGWIRDFYREIVSRKWCQAGNVAPTSKREPTDGCTIIPA
jgi:glyoxylase-like metal-dependent hydrolase (beta-lactamase superfamily II)